MSKSPQVRVYVLNMSGKPLMPCSPTKARKLLESKKAIVKGYNPFTIQLTVASGENRQPITLGVDPGSKFIGLSAATEKAELYAAEVELRQDVSLLLQKRKALRRNRRSRKTRYRPPRFNNRIRNNHKPWFAPSVEHKLVSTLSRIEAITQILPITSIVIEVPSFDIQHLQNPSISGKEYQHGAQFGFRNVHEYVLWRDNYTCQHCKGDKKDPVLQVHHLESRKRGGNAPNNLVTLCSTCHRELHDGKIKLNISRVKSYRHAAHINITRKELVKRLQVAYPELEISTTYGYITKALRDKYHLDKSHHNDAFCIAGNMTATRLGYYYYQKQVRHHNRKLHKGNFLKGGKRQPNQSAYEIKGFSRFDKVLVLTTGEVGFIFGLRTRGYFDVRRFDGSRISSGISYKKLRLLQKRKSYLTEVRYGGGASSPKLP